ncbi:MAG: HEAT repeat domain-containing protein [Nocardioidaceae bacterium]
MTGKRADELPPPSRPDATVRALVTELGERVGAETAAGWCADLLSGADPHDYVAMLDYLGSNCGRAAFDPSWYDYWVRTWGARGLLYVWADSAASTVVQGLGDEHWRPAEMCLKVSSLRELAEAGVPAVSLTEHELPRVRANAVRTLGLVGDTEHVETVESALDDEDPLVRRAADLAMRRLNARLDLPGRSP